MNIIAPALVIGFALIFQPEIRKLFIRIGQNGWFAFGTRSKHTYPVHIQCLLQGSHSSRSHR
jgi:diadenylate cyclase